MFLRFLRDGMFCALMTLDPFTAGAVHIPFLHFILAHYISAFKPGGDEK